MRRITRSRVTFATIDAAAIAALFSSPATTGGPASEPRPASSVPATSRAPSFRSNLRSFCPGRRTSAEDSGGSGLRLDRLRLGRNLGLCGSLGLRLGLLARRRQLLGRLDRPLDRRGPGRGLGPVAPLADAGLLPDLAAQVVELGPVHVADCRDFDLVDLRRVQRKGPLHAHAERLFPNGERLACPRPLSLQDDPLEDLDPLPLTLDHLEVHAHGVPRLELRKSLAQLGALEAVDHVAHKKGPRRADGMLANVDPPGSALDFEDPADQVLTRDEAPEPRVAGRGAVVPEEEEPVRRDPPAGKALVVAPTRVDVRLIELTPVDVDEARPLGPPLAGEPDQPLDECPARPALQPRERGRAKDVDVAAGRLV